MTQDVDIIDLRRSYLPLPPDAFPVTLHNTKGEDEPEARKPIIPYDGYNFMPTPQGYASFFGIGSNLGINALQYPIGSPVNIDDLFMIQDASLQNKLVALTPFGIFTKASASSGAWTREITLAPSTNNILLDWSKCVIDNTIYVYRQGEASVWKANVANAFVFTAFVPTGVNMAGQLGIFKAGGRLAFWDSANAIGWSALTDTSAFGDSDQLSGFTTFQDIVGKIVVCHQHGDGFIIYCTRSVVHAKRNVNSPFLFNGSAIFNGNGISYRREVCYADPDTLHFAFTTNGLCIINAGQEDFLMPEISTFLKEKRDPIYMQMLNGRYLFLSILNDSYFTGRVNYDSEILTGSTFSWQKAARALTDWQDGIGNQPCRVLKAVEKQWRSIDLFNRFGYTANIQATPAGRVRIYSDSWQSWLNMGTLLDYKNFRAGFFGDSGYFASGLGYAASSPIDSISVGGFNLGVIPFKKLPLYSDIANLLPGYGNEVTGQANEQNLWLKTEYIWQLENQFSKDFLYSIETHPSGSVNIPATTVYGTILPTGLGLINREFGPYVDLSYKSEREKQYGVGAEKSVWLERSLTRRMYIKVYAALSGLVTSSSVAKWVKTSGTAGGPGSIYNNVAAVLATAVADFTAAYGLVPNVTVDYTSIVPAAYYRIKLANGATNWLLSPCKTDSLDVVNVSVPQDGIFYEAYAHVSNGVAMSKVHTSTRYDSIPACQIMEIGRAEVSGHGHFAADGTFIVDDAIAEASDFVSVCSAAAQKRTQFAGRVIGAPYSNGVLCGEGTPPSIAGELWHFTNNQVVLPSGAVLFQDGANEPFYPTLIGAHVFDIQYKKWGKMKQDYKVLLDLYPLNQVSGDGTIPYDTFLPKMAMIDASGVIQIFDKYPSDSVITFGKYGEYRKGFTDLEEIKVQFRDQVTGRVVVETSYNGRDIEPALTTISEYSNVRHHSDGYSLSGRWYNITVEANYDLIHLEARARKAARR